MAPKTTQRFPLTINGVRLDTLAFNVRTYDGRRGMPGKRLASAAIPGLHGVLPVLSGGTFEPGEFVLQMWVVGADLDGIRPDPGTPSRAFYDRNLDALLHLFSGTDRLLDIRQTMGDGSVRQALGRVVDAVVPKTGGAEYAVRGEFTVAIEIPAVFWRDVEEEVFTGTASASSPHTLVVSTLTGSTAPIEDAVYLIRGPAASGVRLSCPDSGAWIELQRALAAGEVWRIDSRQWKSVIGGTGMGFDGASTSDAFAVTEWAGSGAYMFTVVPKHAGSTTVPSPVLSVASADRTCHLVLSGSGFGASTQVSLRARRKFL